MQFPRDAFFSEAFRGIEGFSHLWLIFGFHSFKEEKVSALVQPPRFDGEKKFGVFATRSPFRPNHLGLSVVKFLSLDIRERCIELRVGGVDLLSGTPIYDIKPYIPYCDSVPDAQADYFDEAPKIQTVRWGVQPPAEKKDLIEKVIGLDPRPGHYKFLDREHAVLVADWNVKFRYENGEFIILGLEPWNSKKNPAPE